jgi:hypothetical protein
MLRARLTYANVMATLAVFIALGGSGYAASKISGKTIKARTIPGKALRKNTITGNEVKEAKLGKVPAAALADSATSATTAGTATRLAGFDPASVQRPIRWAIVSKTGGILAQSGGISVTRVLDGSYSIDMGEDVSGRLIQGTAFITASDPGDRGPVSVARCGTGPDGADCSVIGVPNDNRHVFVATAPPGEGAANEDHSFAVAVS